MICYAQRQKGVGGVADLERRYDSPRNPQHHFKSRKALTQRHRLNTQGYPLGLKLLDLLLFRTASSSQPSTQRPTRILALLQFIQGPLWRHLFGRPADALERSAERKEEYMITDNDVLVNEFVSVPREISSLNVAAFVAGIIEGVCDGAGFSTKGVSAHWASENGGDGGGMWPGKTVFLVRFSEVVLEREEILGRGGT